MRAYRICLLVALCLLPLATPSAQAGRDERGESSYQVTMLSPWDGQRIARPRRLLVRVLVTTPSERLPGPVTVQLRPAQGRPRTVEVSESETFHLVEGWQHVLEGRASTSGLPGGAYRLAASLGLSGRELHATVSVVIGEPPLALVDAALARLQPLPDDIPRARARVATWDQLHDVVRQATDSATQAGGDPYVDPDNGKVYGTGPSSQTQENVLQKALDKPAWLGNGASAAARAAEMERVLATLTWRAHSPTLRTALARRASSEFCGHSGCADFNDQLAQAAPGLYAAATGKRPEPCPSCASAGVSVGATGAYVFEAAIVRTFSRIGLPQPGDPAAPRFPVDKARLLVTSRSDQLVAGDVYVPLRARVTIRSVPPGWQPRADDWDSKAGGIVLGSTGATARDSLLTAFDLPLGLLLKGSSAPASPAFAPALAVRVDGEEPPPGWPPATSDIKLGPTAWFRVIRGEPVLLYRQAFAPLATPFVAITPSSLDGALGSPIDAGALDFGSQQVGHASEPQRLTVRNAGPGALHVKSLTASAGFAVAAETCTKVPVPTDAACTIDVTFTPPGTLPALGSLEIVDDAESSPRHVALSGTGTARGLPPLSAEPAPDSVHEPHCLPKVEGWKLASLAPTTLDGQVVQGHVTTDDFALNHYVIDYNWFVYPDPAYRRLLADPGNFKEGDPHELGRIEVEWEREHRPWSSGIPAWAWPTQGDRVRVVGAHAVDCGHGDEGFRTEIHPPRLVVTYRNAGLIPFGGAQARLGSFDPVTHGFATRVEVFASSYGGLAVAELGGRGLFGGIYKLLEDDKRAHGGWWQPIGQYDYQLVVKAPPKPEPEAALYHDEQEMPVPVGNSLLQPESVYTELPGGGGYLVTILFSRMHVAKGELAQFGRRIWVGWRSAKPVPKPRLRTYTVTVEKVTIRHHPSKEWSFYGYVNDDAGNLSGGSEESSTHEPVLLVGEDQRTIGGPWAHRTFHVTLIDGQPLHVQFRATVHGTQLAGFQDNLAGIAENILPPDDSTWTTHHSGGTICTPGLGRVIVTCETPSFPFMAAGHEEEDKISQLCHGPTCFTVTYRIERAS